MYGWHGSGRVCSPCNGRTRWRNLYASALLLEVLHLALAALLPGHIRVFCLVVLIQSLGSSSRRRYTLLDFEVAQVLNAVLLLHDIGVIDAILTEVIPTVTPRVRWPSAIAVTIFEECLRFSATVLPRIHLVG